MTDVAQVFADLVRYETRLYNTLNARLRSAHGLTTSQYEFLRAIGAHAGRCRVNDLAEEFAIAVGATSKSMDRLEAAGWIDRRPNPDNRRSSLLALTEEGRRLVDAATPTFDEALRELLSDPLATDSLDHLAAALAHLRGGMERARIGRPAG